MPWMGLWRPFPGSEFKNISWSDLSLLRRGERGGNILQYDAC